MTDPMKPGGGGVIGSPQALLASAESAEPRKKTVEEIDAEIAALHAAKALIPREEQLIAHLAEQKARDHATRDPAVAVVGKDAEGNDIQSREHQQLAELEAERARDWATRR